MSGRRRHARLRPRSAVSGWCTGNSCMSEVTLPAYRTISAVVPYNVRERITRLMVDCSAAIDNDALEEWPDFFLEKCLYMVISRSNYEAGRRAGFIYCDNRNMLIDRIRSLRSANVYQPHLYRHILSVPRILSAQREMVKTETSFAVIRTSLPDGAMMVFSAGRYLDEIFLEGASARFRSRIAVTDSDTIDMLLVIPL